MRVPRKVVRRRAAILALAYLLALQGIFVAWTAATVFAVEQSGLPVTICSSQGATGPSQGSGNLPACCPCGAFCLLSGCTTLGAAPAPDFVAAYQVGSTILAPVLASSTVPQRIAYAPAQARAPPVV
jgi:hypothetical protein